MNYTELEALVATLIGQPDAIIDLMTRTNFSTVVKCLAKSFTQEYQTTNRMVDTQVEYLAFRTAIGAAADTTAVFNLWTPTNMMLAQYGRTYQSVKAVYVAQFTTLGYPDPDAQATTKLSDEATRIDATYNQENQGLC